MGVIAVGTGNDWVRSYGIPTDYEKAVEVIAAGKTFTQDVAKATYVGRSGEQESRYCVNVAGAGMDAAVNLKVCQMKDKGKNGKLAYMMQLAKSVFGYKSCEMEVAVDGVKVEEGMITSVSIGIGQYNGSGMRQLPLSTADDGLLDCTVIDTMSAPKIATVVGRLYDGKIYSVKKVHHHQGRTIEVSSKDVREVEVDGEPLGTTPVRYDIEDKRLTILVP